MADNSCHNEIFELFANESEVDALNSSNESVLHILSDKYDNFSIKLLNILLDKGYDQNLLNDNKESPIYQICKNNYL